MLTLSLIVGSVRSRVQIKGVTEEASGVVSLKHVALTGLNSSLSDLFWITTSVQWSTSLGWPNTCPAPSYLKISPLVAKRSGPTWKDLPLALLHMWSHLRAAGEDKGQGYSLLGNVEKQQSLDQGMVDVLSICARHTMYSGRKQDLVCC